MAATMQPPVTRTIPDATLAEKPDVKTFRLHSQPLYAQAAERLGALQNEKADLEDRLRSAVRRMQEQRKQREETAAAMVVFSDERSVTAAEHEPETLSIEQLGAAIAAHTTAIGMQRVELGKIGDRVSKLVAPQWVAEHRAKVEAFARKLREAMAAHEGLEQFYDALEASGVSWTGYIRSMRFWPLGRAEDSRANDWLKELAEFFPS